MSANTTHDLTNGQVRLALAMIDRSESFADYRRMSMAMKYALHIATLDNIASDPLLADAYGNRTDFAAVRSYFAAKQIEMLDKGR